MSLVFYENNENKNNTFYYLETYVIKASCLTFVNCFKNI